MFVSSPTLKMLLESAFKCYTDTRPNVSLLLIEEVPAPIAVVLGLG
jgi:hypothetical protein